MLRGCCLYVAHVSEQARRVRESFIAAGFTVDGVNAALGPVAAAALGREERVPVLRVFPDSATSALASYVRLFILGDEVMAHPDVPATDLIELGLAKSIDGLLHPLMEVRPYGDDDHDFWVVSDLSHISRRELKPEHVLGVGGASTTLAHITPRMEVGSAADIGAGCGVQSLHLATHVEKIVATDISHRALDAARLSAALSDVEFELRQGSFLEPIKNQTFDLVVSNPPFVISPKAVFEYRDGGLRGDEVGRQLVQDLPAHLNDQGIAVMLANWLHVRGEDWRERVRSWVTGLGVQAWIVQRDVQDPAQYVNTWLRDAAAEGAAVDDHQYDEWLNGFENLNAQAIGFGWIVLRKTGTELITIEDHSMAHRLPTGGEVIQELDNQVLLENLDAFAILNSVFRAADGLVVAPSSHFVDGQWMPGLVTMSRPQGWRSAVSVDDVGLSLIKALDGYTPVGELLDALAQDTGIDPDEVLAGGLLTIRALLAAGLVTR